MEAARSGSSFLTFFGLVFLTWAFRLWNVVVRSGGVDGGRKEELAGGYGGRSWRQAWERAASAGFVVTCREGDPLLCFLRGADRGSLPSRTRDSAWLRPAEQVPGCTVP